ncbi:DNA sulfur modification protein DndD [Terribacillus saccharophilus]|uniref:DNA sulfur modification protein DndD n=1 Tax=Terribacillus saccharophilus TaxID=361277 RepID=UPI000C9A440F|nr:DNA sulfur modification protein DndD [Terribacillus goriensis]
MKFKKLIFENYKTYYGHQEIDLSISKQDVKENKNIILLGGLNGAGKTTILKAVRYVLFGQRGISSYEYKRLLAGTINNTYFDEGGRECSVTLTMEMGNDELWTLHISWRFDRLKKLVKEDRSISIKRNTDAPAKKVNITDISTYNHFIDRIIPYNAAPFFIFDGEEIKELILKQNSQEMKEAIHKITGLESYKILLSDLNELESSLLKKLSTATKQSTINEHQKRYAELETQVDKYETHLEKINKKISELDTEINKTRQVRDSKITNNSKSREVIVKKQAKVVAQLEIRKNELESYYQDNVLLLILSDIIKKLKEEIKKENNLKNKRIMLENSLEPYNKFISELLSHKIDPQLTQQQLQQIKKIGEQVWLKDRELESVKGKEIHDLSSKDYQYLFSLPVRDIHQLQKLRNEVGFLKQQYEHLEDQIRSAPESVDIEKENKRLSYLDQQRGQLTLKSQAAHKKLRPLKDEMTTVRNKLTRVSDKDISADIINNKLVYLEKVKAFSKEYLEKATHLKAQLIQTEFELMLRKLFRKDDEFGKVHFDINNYAVRLYNDKNQEISILDRSAGEMQMISSALIWALIKVSDLELPMVIDTPLGRLDSIHRNRLIEHYYKHLSEQVIILSTDTEITQDYVRMMQEHSVQQYLLDYNEDRKYTIIRDGYFDIAGGIANGK